MKNKLNRLLFIITAFILSVSLHAQNSQLNIGYSISQPTGSYKTFISNTSYSGYSLSFLHSFTGQAGIKIEIDNQNYYQKYPRAIYQYGISKGSDISAVMTNTISTTSIEVKGVYNLLKSGLIKPYVAGGGGVNLISYDQYMGEFDNPAAVIKPVLGAEAGIYFPFTKISTSGLRISAHYNYMPFNNYDVKTLNNWGVQAAVSIGLKGR